ncbi:MAG: Gfo/Idh/MocA family oxidoreductase [Clostridiaceae bacterium]|nr:Gfo/Idh/MocA family oxidoreductase [Clostridiaceae bacterium]
MKTIKIGVVGLGRGMTFANPEEFLGVKLQALCDIKEEKLKQMADKIGGGIQTYTNFDDMLASDIDAVVLANYFDEHAPFAIKALQAGKHVMSECSCNSTIAEGVALCRAVEKSGKIYMLAENYPYSRTMMELRRIYQAGELGQAMYGDGEYNHPMSADVNNEISPGEFHWRNTLPATYYCTHALAPLMVATDTMPVSISGFAIANDEVYRGTAKRSDPGAAIICRMDNGAIFKLLGTGLPGHSGYYRLHGSHGAAEIERRTGQLLVWHDEWDIPHDSMSSRTYMPEWSEYRELANKAGHGGGDFWTTLLFTKAIRENVQPYLDVYRGVAMSSVGIQAWKSALQNGVPLAMPDFKNEASRVLYEKDIWNPILKAGVDITTLPPASIVGYEPTADDLAAARAIWEKTNYSGLK